MPNTKKAEITASFSTAEAALSWLQKIGDTYRGAVVVAKQTIGNKVSIVLEAVGSILTAAAGSLKDLLPFSVWGTCSIKPA